MIPISTIYNFIDTVFIDIQFIVIWISKKKKPPVKIISIYFEPWNSITIVWNRASILLQYEIDRSFISKHSDVKTLYSSGISRIVLKWRCTRLANVPEIVQTCVCLYMYIHVSRGFLKSMYSLYRFSNYLYKARVKYDNTKYRDCNPDESFSRTIWF